MEKYKIAKGILPGIKMEVQCFLHFNKPNQANQIDSIPVY